LGCETIARWYRGYFRIGATESSKRTLARRMQSVLGKTPLAYFQDLRIERAVHLLRTSHASVDQIAAEVGYTEGVTLRALLRRRLGRGVRKIRHSP
jgi:transcriptional regulator GlxA family with amidase domain